MDATPKPEDTLAPHPMYFEVKAAECELALTHQQLHAEVEREAQAWAAAEFRKRMQPFKEKRDAVRLAAGLDLTKAYAFNDPSRTITEHVPEQPTTAAVIR